MRPDGTAPVSAPAEAVPSDLAALEGVERSEAIVSEDAPASPPLATAPATIPARRPAPRVSAVRPASSGAVPAAPPQEAAPSVVAITPVAPAPIEPSSLPLPEPAPIIEPPAPQFQELVLAGDSVIGLQMESRIDSETARLEDEVVARVTRDVRVGDRVAIPAGSTARGEVTLVERGGKLRDRARLGVTFTSIVRADGTRIPIATESIYREGDAPGRESASKIGGGAIGGAILGGILGGAKGAAIGGSIGAGAGSAAVLAGGRNAATLTPGSPVTIRLREPATVVVEQ
jgi:hypothetical protein